MSNIAPALSKKDWAEVLFTPGHIDTPSYRNSMVDDLDRMPDEDIPAAIAYLNARLKDDDPRKITREWVEAIRNAVVGTDIGAPWPEFSRRMDFLKQMADALSSYLPPPPDPTDG